MNDSTSVVVSIAIVCAMVLGIVVSILIYSGYKRANPGPQPPTAKVRLTCVDGPTLDCKISR